MSLISLKITLAISDFLIAMHSSCLGQLYIPHKG